MATTLPLTRITGPVETPLGLSPQNGAVIMAMLRTVVVGDTTVVPRPQRYPLDAEGLFDADVAARVEEEDPIISYAAIGVWWDDVNGVSVQKILGYISPVYSASPQPIGPLLVDQLPEPVPTDLLAAIVAAVSAVAANTAIVQGIADDLAGLTTPFAVGSGGTGATTASGARSNLGLVIGTDVQAQSPALQMLAGLPAPFTAGDELRRLEIKGDLTGYQLGQRAQLLISVFSQSNVARVDTAYGPSLLEHEDFPDGLPGWTDISTGTGVAESVDDELRIVRTDASNVGGITRSIATEADKTYRVQIERITSSGAALRVGTTSGGGQIYDTAIGAGRTTVEIVATTTTTWLSIVGADDASDSTYTGVSFHKKGWEWRRNLKVFNGGINGTIGTAFVDPDPDQMRTFWAYADRIAQAFPDTDICLLLCATGGVGVRSVVGLSYDWDTGLSGDPGTGCIAFDNATPGSVTEVRYHETDADGWVRFVGGSKLGESAVTPARIEVVGDPTVFVEFETGAMTDAGTYRSQPVVVTDSASWPPADGTAVIVYPAETPMRDVIRLNAEAALDALGRKGAARFFDKWVLPPTEADISYADSYFGRDHGLLRAYLDTWSAPETMYTYTLPWPYSTSAPVQVQRWWYEIEEIVVRDGGSSVLVDLRATDLRDWEAGANDYIHIDQSDDMLRVGALIAASEMRGGQKLPRYDSGSWTPTLTGVANIDALLLTKASYQRIGRTVNGWLNINPDPTLGGLTATSYRVSLPIPSDFQTSADATGQGVSSVTNYTSRVSADPTNDELLVTFTSESTASYQQIITFSYKLN